MSYKVKFDFKNKDIEYRTVKRRLKNGKYFWETYTIDGWGDDSENIATAEKKKYLQPQIQKWLKDYFQNIPQEIYVTKTDN